MWDKKNSRQGNQAKKLKPKSIIYIKTSISKFFIIKFRIIVKFSFYNGKVGYIKESF